ncbi:hypothetical protein M3Y96_01206700 [Aphelenchoides besseyi]|nr:hypothetical protein M3Y96_01206700 [Aphelenchoides besseyi]
MFWNPIFSIWWMAFLLIGLYVNAQTLWDCVTEPNIRLIINGGCKEIHGELITISNELEFELKYREGMPNAANVKFFIAGCKIEFSVSDTYTRPALISFGNSTEGRYFPINIALEPKEFVIYYESKEIRNKCFAANQPGEPGQIVGFNFTTDNPIPNLDITFPSANIYKLDLPEEQEWNISGWRLWVSFVGGLILLLGVSVIGGLIYWFYKHKNDASRFPQEPPSRFSKLEWQWPRNFYAADAEELQCCINSSDPEVVRDFVKTFPIHNAKLIAQMKQWLAQMENEHKLLERQPTDEHSTLFNTYNTIKLFVRIWEEENAKLRK